MAASVSRTIPSLLRQHAARRFTTSATTKFPTTTTTTAALRSTRVKNYNNKVFTRNYASGGPRGGETAGSKNPFPVYPLVAIFTAGTLGFYYLVQSRKEPMPAIEDPKDKLLVSPPVTKKPAFSKGEASVIFVLGGPGAGKGTQCGNLVRDYGFVHLSAGDLLRAEQERPGSDFGELIKTYIKEGRIVPMEVTIALLENAMREAMTTQGKSKFLIDGFPRQMDQAVQFEKDVCESSFTLFFDCTEDEMLKRLLNRGLTSGRSDDNIESIKKRFRTFKETSYPVVEYYRKMDKVIDVKAMDSPQNVYSQVKAALKDRLSAEMKSP